MLNAEVVVPPLQLPLALDLRSIHLLWRYSGLPKPPLNTSHLSSGGAFGGPGDGFGGPGGGFLFNSLSSGFGTTFTIT